MVRFGLVMLRGVRRGHRFLFFTFFQEGVYRGPRGNVCVKKETDNKAPRAVGVVRRYRKSVKIVPGPAPTWPGGHTCSCPLQFILCGTFYMVKSRGQARRLFPPAPCTDAAAAIKTTRSFSDLFGPLPKRENTIPGSVLEQYIQYKLIGNGGLTLLAAENDICFCPWPFSLGEQVRCRIYFHVQQ